MESKNIVKPKKSVKLTEEQVRMLSEKYRRYDSKTEAAFAIGVNRDVIERIILVGSCSEKTFIKLFGKTAFSKTMSRLAAA